MRKFKNIQFDEGINLPLSDFKKVFAVHLIGLSEKQVKQAYKVAIDGNIITSKKERKGVKKSKE